MENLIKIADLGVPLFLETPIYNYIYIYISFPTGKRSGIMQIPKRINRSTMMRLHLKGQVVIHIAPSQAHGSWWHPSFESKPGHMWEAPLFGMKEGGRWNSSKGEKDVKNMGKGDTIFGAILTKKAQRVGFACFARNWYLHHPWDGGGRQHVPPV